MATQPTYADALAATIESELAADEAQFDAIYATGRLRAKEEQARQEQEDELLRGTGGDAVRETASRLFTDEEKASIDRLQARAKRLRQVQKLFKDDPDLMRIVDETIGGQVKAAEQRQQAVARATQRRQTVLSVCFSVLSLIVGWLLSAVSPVSAVAHLVGH